MKIEKIVMSGLVATSLMTIFSYTVSNIKGRNFKEPELLSDFFRDILTAKSNAQLSLPAGWFTHYSMGLCWSLLENYLLESNKMKANLKDGLLFGCFGGITGILIWDLMFKLDPRPPVTPYREFYRHLVFAHVVYSLSVVLLDNSKANPTIEAGQIPIVLHPQTG